MERDRNGRSSSARTCDESGGNFRNFGTRCWVLRPSLWQPILPPMGTTTDDGVVDDNRRKPRCNDAPLTWWSAAPGEEGPGTRELMLRAAHQRPRTRGPGPLNTRRIWPEGTLPRRASPGTRRTRFLVRCIRGACPSTRHHATAAFDRADASYPSTTRRVALPHLRDSQRCVRAFSAPRATARVLRSPLSVACGGRTARKAGPLALPDGSCGPSDSSVGRDRRSRRVA